MFRRHNFIVLCFANLFGITSVMAKNCATVGSEETLWIDGRNGSIVEVELSTTKNQSLCNDLRNCSIETRSNSSGLFNIHSISLQYGQLLRIHVRQSKLCHNCTVKVHEVNISHFHECIINCSGPTSGKEDTADSRPNEIGELNSSGDSGFFAEYNLEGGIHFFIVEVPENETVRCQNGFRLNVTVKDQACKENENVPVCSGHGICLSSFYQNNFTCRCCDGYFGPFCNLLCEGGSCSTPCHNDNCQNGGTCIVDYNSTESNSAYRCLCPGDTAGLHCEHLLTSCRSNPCVHGVCVEKPGNYQCYCVPGFHGKQCELEYNECLSNPCQNHGTCIDRIDSYECRCTSGHNGINCQEKVDLCNPSPCHKNGTCIDRGDTAYCVCPQGITGARCEDSIKECASSPCYNQGTCIDLERGFECRCPITFAGVHCEYMMDVFAPALDRTNLSGEAHVHNLYIVAGTLCGAICLMAVILLGCYCKMHETYRQLSWRRHRYKRRSLSCPDLESFGKSKTFSKSRLSVDAVLEATSLCYDNTSFETPLKQPLQVQQI